MHLIFSKIDFRSLGLCILKNNCGFTMAKKHITELLEAVEVDYEWGSINWEKAESFLLVGETETIFTRTEHNEYDASDFQALGFDVEGMGNCYITEDNVFFLKTKEVNIERRVVPFIEEHIRELAYDGVLEECENKG